MSFLLVFSRGHFSTRRECKQVIKRKMEWLKLRGFYLLCLLVNVAPISRSSTPNIFLKSLKFRLIEVILVPLDMITSISLSLVGKVMRARVGNVWRKRRIRKSESRKVITSCETKSLFFLGVMWTHFSTLFFTVVVDVCPLDLRIHTHTKLPSLLFSQFDIKCRHGKWNA